MKKAIVTLCAILAVSTSLMAAGHVDSVRYLTTKAGQNWFISANGTIDWWQGTDRNPGGNFTKVQWDKPSFGGGVAVGKWITHKVGVRLAYDVNGFNSYIDGRHIGLSNIQFLYDGENPEPVSVFDYNGQHYEYYATHGMYHHLHADFLFSPIDFFQGYYNPNRIWTPVLHFGMGAACISEHAFVLQSIINKEPKNFELSWQAGLDNNFRLNDYFDLNLNFNWTGQRWTIDSWTYEYGGHTGSSATVRPKRADYNYSAALGLTWYIGGRIYELPYNYEKEMKEMSERIKNLEDELAAVPAVAPIVAPADTVYINVNEIEAISYPFSIFFNLDSYELMSKRDLVNLRELATVAKEQGYKLRLRGSCDSATATPEYNQRLSENRCRKIQDELIKLGFPEEDIVLEPVGGVKELDPTEFDRRVLIDIIKYNDKK